MVAWWAGKFGRRTGLAAAVLVTAAGFALVPERADAKACDAKFYAELRSKPEDGKERLRVNCDITLDREDVITRKLVFAGERASGLTLDCRGGTIGAQSMRTTTNAPSIQIRSVKGKDDKAPWSVPRDITIRNCKVIGNIRLVGLGPNGEAEEVRKSSLHRNHTQNAQANAPSGITLSKVEIVAKNGIPLYFGPGVTNSTVRDSVFKGSSKKTAIYLDAESAGNAIIGNTFRIKAGRELIAVDGSARNTISGNLFDKPDKGAVYVYRNCGEGGTIRHQKPQGNKITDNRFVYDGLARPAIWLNQRNVGKVYCRIDPRYPFGSSIDFRDFANDNLVKGNRFEGPWSPRIVNFDKTNTVTDNE